MKQKILGLIAFLFLRTLSSTWRYRVQFNEEDTDFFKNKFKKRCPDFESQYVLAFFHQDELSLIPFFRGTQMTVLISASKDGEIMNMNAKLFGYDTVRGSSSRKAVAGLIAAIKRVKQGYKMTMAVDGPRGPIYKVKDGALAISKKAEIPILAVRAFPAQYKCFEKSWNKAKLPKPFSKIDVVFAKLKNYHSNQELEDQLLALKAP
jgi:lysophospholipid acyltransferase (LPLAT)-like uncharacterized protein